MTRPKVKVLFYAINGTGLGQLSRLLAIARPMRDLVQGMDYLPDLRFVTTSEGNAAAHDFPVYKFPSRTAAEVVPQAEFAASSKLLISNLVAQFSPDILVNDTLAEGSFGEISFLLSYVGSSVLIDGHKDPAITASESYRRHVTLYSKVLVPDHFEAAERYPVPRHTRQEFVGPIHGYHSAYTATREEAAQTFGVRDDQRLLYLSGGAGSDSREGIQHLIEALSQDPRNFLLVGYGPLHKRPVIYRPNLVPLFAPDARRWFPALDGAISAAGYNLYEELLAARVPTLFFPQSKGMDRQDERVRLGLERGWHGFLPSDLLGQSHEQLRQQVESLLGGPRRAMIAQALGERPQSVGALRAAVEILGLAPQVERDRLYEAALHHRVAAGPGYAAAHQSLAQWWDGLCTTAERSALKERAILDWLRPRGETGWEHLDRFARLLGSLDASCREELLKAWAHHGPEETEEEQRVSLGNALQVLCERGLVERLPTFLQILKLPARKAAVLWLVSLLESDRESEARELLEGGALEMGAESL